MNIEENVPTMIPITRASENPCNTGPPNKSSERAVSSVSPEVRMVRLFFPCPNAPRAPASTPPSRSTRPGGAALRAFFARGNRDSAQARRELKSVRQSGADRGTDRVSVVYARASAVRQHATATMQHLTYRVRLITRRLNLIMLAAPLMESPALVDVALHVLKSWTCGECPSAEDLRVLHQHAIPEEANLAPDDLACAIIARECRKTVEAARSKVSKKGKRIA